MNNWATTPTNSTITGMINFQADNLVLYKNQAARIVSVAAKKINIVLQSGTAVSVRPKDITLLHSGPLRQFSELTSASGDLLTAWELLAGETTSLEELSELAFDNFTPATAWAIWQALDDNLHFGGTIEQIIVHTEDEVAAKKEARTAKAAEAASWDAFAARVQRSTFLVEDGRFLQEIAAVAMGQQERSQV
ncbi:MAG: RNB domain-containing ribonuclease, partial [Chloroflexi bacterium]|nr:RNB domain-containing ribonuclease [Chloroflexota bacterium]